MMYQLPPSNISDFSYHDYLFEGIRLNDDEVTIEVRHPDSLSKCMIILSQVEVLIVNDLMLGNIIESIDCHDIDEHIRVAAIQQISNVESGYINKEQMQALDKSSGLVGKKYVTINPTYGVELYAICRSVSELFIE